MCKTATCCCVKPIIAAATICKLVVSLLRLQARRASTPEVREILHDAVERVFILSHARKAMIHQASLESALRQVCEALQAHAEPHGILLSFQASGETIGLSSTQITSLALVVNELATNAIKHAFEDGQTGRIHIEVQRNSEDWVTIIVDDDGLPFPEIGGNSQGPWPGPRHATYGVDRRVSHPPVGWVQDFRNPCSLLHPFAG